MYTVAGVTGNVGSAVARALLDAGAPTTVLVRDPAAGRSWQERGAEVRVVDLRDRSALAAVLRDSTGFFTLLPFSPAVPDIAGDQAALTTSIAGAVADSGVPHVALLSSLGADLEHPPQVVAWLRDLEQRLGATGTILSAVRCTHFQEKVAETLGPATADGAYPVFASRADVPVPMVAARDVGALVAGILMAPPTRSQVVDVLGPAVTEQEVATALGRALGSTLEVVVVPREAWTATLVSAGLPPRAAELLAELYDAGDRGLLVPAGDRLLEAGTPVAETIDAMLARV
ncbi:NmrA family NAD(P)-binding protein [Georgenia alba]|uniref:NmrA family NAD(P)-binding protein n=1 Tax=Georgenia alba TaxID=2233858 RepID=A0ABW2Q9J8_9MICO